MNALVFYKANTLLDYNNHEAHRTSNIGALIVTYTILGVPYCIYII